jgi:hypothetical protein
MPVWCGFRKSSLLDSVLRPRQCQANREPSDTLSFEIDGALLI